MTAPRSTYNFGKMIPGYYVTGLLYVVARDIAGHERFGHMTRVYYKYA